MGEWCYCSHDPYYLVPQRSSGISNLPCIAGSGHPAFDDILSSTLRVQAPTDGDMGPDFLGALET